MWKDLFRETFFTCEKFPYGTFRTYLSKTRLKGDLFMGRCPKPHQGNDSLGTPFACGAGERNTPFTCLYYDIPDIFHRKSDSFCKSGCRGMIPLPGFLGTESLRNYSPAALLPTAFYSYLFIFRRNDSFCKSGQGGDPPCRVLRDSVPKGFTTL